LQNSTDAKILQNLEKDLKKKQNLLDDTIDLLGNEDIKNLDDLESLLEGKTLAELKEAHQVQLSNRNSEINKLVQQLDQLKEKTKFYLDNLKTKESLIAEYQAELKEKDQAAQQQAEALEAKNNLYEKLEKAKDQLEEELNHNLTLKEAKITTLETNLLNLAKQKLINQKQAKALVEQLERE
jgi:hypothetical protein